ncbi:hypothetical protein BDN70DRAFT_779241, partial [Pholiota conissans]
LQAKFSFFIEAVSSDQCAFLQLTPEVFVANDWNMGKDEATYQWVHIHSIRHGTGYKIGCQCTRGRKNSDCFHIRYLLELQSTKFPPIPDLADDPYRTFLCAQFETAQDGIFDTIFSVPPPRAEYATTIKQRAIVEHHGDDNGKGTWKCSKDLTATSCPHIVQARHSLQQHIQCNLDAHDDDAGTGSLEYQASLLVRRPATTNESVSYELLPPPKWARIRTDPAFYEPPFFDIHNAAAIIRLDETASCCCTSPRTMYNPFQPILTRDCMIYGLDGAVKAMIEVQNCPNCSHRLIGPDCRSIGLFNWNNRTLLTHDLLDDYTSQYTTSETPFIAWTTVISRRYEARSLDFSFISDRLFRAIWFSYIQLVQLDNDMCCTVCGPNPEAVIFDGVTLAFNRKHLLTMLTPPTALHHDSVRKDLVVQVPNLQCIPHAKLRSDIRTVLKGPQLLLPQQADNNIDGDSEGETDSACSGRDDLASTTLPLTKRRRKANAMEARIKMIPGVILQLSAVNSDLANLFDRCYGPAAIMLKHKASPVYKQLFMQIAAEETCLQLTNGEALESLRSFCAATLNQEAPNLTLIDDLASRLTLIPALYDAIRYELKNGGIQSDMLGTCRWIYLRGATAMKLLIKYPTPPVEIDVTGFDKADRWQETGSCYGMPKIRHCPEYPHLKHENARDSGGKEKKGEGCQKFYSKYGQSRLTGGIMCVWCSHSVCYGFHCIPSAEGQNDVFSAVYTRWKTAPKVIVYDFACALKPYCMTREPDFFSKTLFAIDAFHAMGHTKCGQAAFLNTYCDANPELLYINSSAAECGNGGILRIRKPVAYMSQERAIIFTKTFVSIWNRHRLRKMER